ncbi:MAG: hypothetical protein H0T53_15825 [Herpetosiphonaceae bacterium]|nr:hypothetical protein [Herpetosiphonaceae bacterium]
MNEGICAKCAQATVYAVTADDNERALAISAFKAVLMTHFICTSCGYVEQYVLDPADRQKIEQKARLITPRQS